MYVALMRPLSRDRLRLAGRRDVAGKRLKCGDVLPPESLYFSAAEDVETIAWATERILALVKSLGGVKVHVPPAGSHSGAALREWIRTNRHYSTLSMSHFGGSCSFDGCVEDNLRVTGTSNVFVADLSILPAPLSTHPVATAMMIGERATALVVHHLSTFGSPSLSTNPGLAGGDNFSTFVALAIAATAVSALVACAAISRRKYAMRSTGDENGQLSIPLRSTVEWARMPLMASSSEQGTTYLRVQ